jgi:hypothetical protein
VLLSELEIRLIYVVLAAGERSRVELLPESDTRAARTSLRDARAGRSRSFACTGPAQRTIGPQSSGSAQWRSTTATRDFLALLRELPGKGVDVVLDELGGALSRAGLEPATLGLKVLQISGKSF